MNKQYVIEKIDAAVEKVRAEYDPILKNIVECPVCGALTFRCSEHVCLSGKAEHVPEIKKQKRMTLDDYILAVLPEHKPDQNEIFDHDSPYMPKGISKAVMKSGYTGKPESVGASFSDLVRKGKVNFMAVTVKEKYEYTGKQRERLTPGFAYWRSA